jgi:putative ABC transport system permease protein
MFLALKEMQRSKVRFTLLTLAVAFLAFLILFIQGLSTGLIDQFIGALRNQSADVLVYSDQARKNLEGSIITPEQLAEVEAAAGAQATVGRLGEGTFTVTAGGEDTDAVLFGYDILNCPEPSPDGCGDLAPAAPTTLSSGRYPTADREAVASSRNASEGFDIGDTVTVEPDGRPITVVGLAEDINYSVSPTLFVSWDTYEEARKVRNPDAVEVLPSVAAVIAPEGVAPALIAERIAAEVPGVQPLTTDEAVNGSPGVSAVRQSLGGVVLVTLLIVPIVASFFFVILTVQKTPSLILLRALGATKRSLVTAVVVQAGLVLIGGYAIALALTLLLGRVAAGSVGVSMSPGVVLSILVALLLLCGIGLSAAVRRVLRIDPIQATQSQGVLA